MAGTLETGAGTASLLLKWEKPQPEQEVGLPAQLPTWRAQVVLQAAAQPAWDPRVPPGWHSVGWSAEGDEKAGFMKHNPSSNGKHFHMTRGQPALS